MSESAMPADVRLEEVVKEFGETRAVDGISLEIPRGSFFALLGPSGCGKTTTLRMIGGFEDATSGRIFLGDRDVVGLPPYKRDVNTVFQSYALFPHMTIADNVAFGLERKKLPKAEVRTRVAEILELVGLAGRETSKPRQLSGGQQQRVALARAIVCNPRVLLLDEPLGALDLKLRKQMQLELKRIQNEVGITFVHVTHDQEEAMTMADTIAVMNGGRIEQLGTPAELYERPRTAFVAGFLGKSNLLAGTVAGDGLILLADGSELRASTNGARGAVSVGVRPEKISLADGGVNRLSGKVKESAYIGVATEVVVATAVGELTVFHQNVEAGGVVAGGRLGGHPVLVAGGDLRDPKRRGELAMSTTITRRQLVQRGAAGLTLLSLPGLLAACGGSGGGGGGGGELADVLRFSNWPLYIDYDEKAKTHPTLDQFTAKTGIKVDYFEDINSNAEYFGKIQRPLSQGQSIDRDIIVLTDNERFLGLMIDKGWVEELDKDLIPNFANLIDAQKSPPFDPDRKYSLPWQSGMTGIAWNEKITGPVTSITQLFEDPKLKGKVTALNGMGDTPGLVMLDNGDDPSNVTDETWNAALERIQSAVDSGQIRRFTGNDYAQPLSQGDLAAAIAWSGDIYQLLSSNPSLKWALPTKGGIIWTDNMIIPTGGSVPTASTYMNFVYDPKIAAQITAYVAYVPPVSGTQAVLQKSDPELAKSQLVFPSDEVLAKTHQYDSAALNNQDYIEQWQRVLGA